MSYNYIPKYIRQSENKSPKSVVTASRWNELFNLLIKQGDHTAEELGNILNYFSTRLVDVESEISESAEAIANIREVFRINVTYSNGVYSADKTFAEIKAAYEAGQQPYIVYDGNTIYTLSYCYFASEQMFMNFERYLIGEDTLKTETLRIYSYTTASGSNIVKRTSSFDVPSGASDHSQLTNRDAANQHPITAITGLQTALDSKADVADIPSLEGCATEAYVQNYHDNTKQDTITDLATIRSGASKGATAVQPEVGKGLFSGSYNDLTDKPAIPDAVTEGTVSGWGFTKNTGTYSKPAGGIPKADLAAAVQTSLGKADTALQSHQSLAAYRTAAAQDVIDSGKVDKVTGKGLSSNDYTAAAKAKVDAIPANPKYTDTVYDDTALKERVATIEGKESAWDAKLNASELPTAINTALGYTPANDADVESLSSNQSTLSARMDTFTALGEGSTTGDAELIDARVDCEGKTWTNAGGHIRGITEKIIAACCDKEATTGINLLKPSECLYSKRLSNGTADIVDSIAQNVVTAKIPVTSGNWYALSRELNGSRTTIGEKASNSNLSRILFHLKDGSTAGAYAESGMDNAYVKLVNDGTGYAFKVLSNDVESMQIQIYFNIDISTSDKLKANKVMLVTAGTLTEAVSKAINSEYVDGDSSIFKYILKKDETKVDNDTFNDRVKEIISEQTSAKNLFSFENGDANISLLSKNKPETDYIYETSSTYGHKDVENGYYVCNGGTGNYGIKYAMPLKPKTGSYLLSAEVYIPSGNTERTKVSFGVCCYPENTEGQVSFKEPFDLKSQNEWVKIEKVVSVKDEHAAVYVSFASYIDTYPFYLRNIQFTQILGRWVGKTWVTVGDSITEKNEKTLKNYHDYIAENTGIEVVNMGVSGTGYKNYENTNKAFYQRILNVPTDADVITIFGSGNDCGGNYTIGDVTDTGTDTLCGCINKTIDNLYSVLPTAQLGIITPTPWSGFNPANDNNIMAQYSSKIVEICRRRGIPCLDLYHCSGMRPWDASFRTLMYPLNSAGDEHEGVHPNELGHAFFASKIQAFLETLIL